MPNPSVTYTFSNSTTADASQINTNYTDLINSMTDGTKSFSIADITAAGTATFNGHVNLGNSSADDLTITASLAATLSIKTNASFDIGSSTLGLRALYFGNSTFTTKLQPGTLGASNTITMPPTTGTVEVYAGYSSISGDTNLVAGTHYMCTSTLVGTLPSAATNSGLVIEVSVTGASAIVTINTTSAQTVGGRASGSIKLILGDFLKVRSNGTNWVIIGKHETCVVTANTMTGNSGSDASWTEVKDTHGAFDGTTFSVPIAGYYQVLAKCRCTAATIAIDNIFSISILVDSVIVSFGSQSAGATTQSKFFPAASYVAYLTAGQTIKTQWSSDATTPSVVSSSTASTLSIVLLNE